ncbi:SLC13 family permease [Opitutus sp. ER46]|uniref:SLC13 family permease n=1 Tax=Opitutus sp. ER46 TaxID=2161864 RepID=UPI000D2F8151|nr:SLC13 family permease [Opitutus sp. ER46]PTX98415.1 SLC13 family permease [Opitutus sp. ER46]
MTFQIALLLALIAAALVFFSFDWVPSDVVALGLVLTLIMTGLLSPEDAFAGFGSDTVIMILGLLIMTTALIRTGVVDLAGRAILRHAGTNPSTLLAVIMIGCAALSAFISNTAAAAFFLPIVLGVATKAKMSPSCLLMPLAFASILTSSVTLISTSTNLVVSGLIQRAGMPPMGIFELTPVGVPVAIAGLLYMYFIGRHLVQDRAEVPGLLEQFGLRSYISEVVVMNDSPLVGKTIAEAGLGRDMDLAIVRVVRDRDRYLLPRSEMMLQAGDMLLVEGAQSDVLNVKDTAGLEIRADLELSDPDLRDEDAALVEALIVPGSRLAGRSLRDAALRQRYGVQVLGLNRHGKNILTKLSHVTLRAGDVLLIQGRTQGLQRLAGEGLVSILQAIEGETGKRPKAWRSVIIFVAALTLAATNLVPLAVAVLAGAFLTLATRCISPTEAYRDLDWRVVILIACMLALAQAMMKTGAAQYLAEHVAALTSGYSPLLIVAGFFILTVALTQPMSNQAAAAVIVPIAIQTALHLGLNPRTFVMAIAVAASCSYITPLEPACLMVYGPGRYRFFDFVKVGLPLVVVVFVIAMILVPRIWPLGAR